MSRLYLVYGASGAQGGAVASALLGRGERVRLVLRSADRNPFKKNPNVEIAIGDLADKASLVRASRGVDGVSLVVPLIFDQGLAVQWGNNAIEAAVEAQAPMLVFNASSVVPPEKTGITAIDIKVELEAALAKAVIPSVVLQPTVYNGNLAAPWLTPAIVHQGIIAYPISAQLRVSWISWEEAAAYTIAALDRPALAARKPVFRIGGATALNGAELAQHLGEVLGKRLNYVALPLDQFEAGLNAALGNPVGTEIARFYAWMNDSANGFAMNVELGPALAELPITQISFTDWARSVPWRALAGDGK